MVSPDTAGVGESLLPGRGGSLCSLLSLRDATCWGFGVPHYTLARGEGQPLPLAWVLVGPQFFLRCLTGVKQLLSKSLYHARLPLSWSFGRERRLLLEAFLSASKAPMPLNTVGVSRLLVSLAPSLGSMKKASKQNPQELTILLSFGSQGL